MAVLEFLAATARTWVITARGLIHTDRLTYLLTGIATGSRTLIGIAQIAAAVFTVLGWTHNL